MLLYQPVRRLGWTTDFGRSSGTNQSPRWSKSSPHGRQATRAIHLQRHDYVDINLLVLSISSGGDGRGSRSPNLARQQAPFPHSSDTHVRAELKRRNPSTSVRFRPRVHRLKHGVSRNHSITFPSVAQGQSSTVSPASLPTETLNTNSARSHTYDYPRSILVSNTAGETTNPGVPRDMKIIARGDGNL